MSNNGVVLKTKERATNNGVIISIGWVKVLTSKRIQSRGFTEVTATSGVCRENPARTKFGGLNR